MSAPWSSAEHGYEIAYAARKAAHPEVNLDNNNKPITFEEYSDLLQLSPAEPLGSRIDEFAVHFLNSTQPVFVGITPEYILGVQEQLERVALLVGALTYRAWLQDNRTNISQFTQWNSESGCMVAYRQYTFREACAHVWTKHVAQGGPYGPAPRHHFLRGTPRFNIPGQEPPPPPPRPTVEPPSSRLATAEDIADGCPICLNLTPMTLGETLLTVLPCDGSKEHFFHPGCILPWFVERGGQDCVYRCTQRMVPPPPPPPIAVEEQVPEHENYDYTFTFPDGPNVGWPA